MKDFQGFRFGPYHSSDLHLEVVSSSDRFIKNVLPSPTDYTLDISGSNGKYYFGQTYGTREFTVNVAFESIDETTWRRISQIFSTDKPQDLVFDENPYKTYRAKCSKKPEFKFVCFRDNDTGKRVYKGEGSFSFICYHPLAYCFNKYVVRAADYYKCISPQQIIEDKTVERSKYIPHVKEKILPGLLKDHYNTIPNMDTPWKGGYPTISQVQHGELFFNLDGAAAANKTMITDVRGYWNNIPLWQDAAKLLTTPTLDYDQELIYMPQYNRFDYYNMDTGLNKTNGIIGSRLLVYNPGDVPVDFELRLGNLSSKFRKNLDNYTFRISRFNVQRLTIQQAVDWTGLKTYNSEFEDGYKYGTKYFTIAETPQQDGEDINYTPYLRQLNMSHPNHCYIVEPIPQKRLGHFIKLFYWQSNLLFNKNNGEDTDINKHILNHEQGIEYANRYEELYENCITDDERNELYWHTLKAAILDRYREINGALNLNWFNKDYTYEQFVHDFIHHPSEYIRVSSNLNYGEFNFNIGRLPQFITEDYLDINSNGFENIPNSICGCDVPPVEDSHREHITPLFLDSDKRLLYYLEEPEWSNKGNWFKNNSDKTKNFYNYKPKKKTLNDNIERGHWFKLPPGWSLIDISPIVNQTIWGGKRWLDSRPFDWGTPNENFRKRFNGIYRAAVIEYLTSECPDQVFEKYNDEVPENKREFFEGKTVDEIEDYMQFRRWYPSEYSDTDYKKYYELLTSSKRENIQQKALLNIFAYELSDFTRENAEIGFLKTLASFWKANNVDSTGEENWSDANVDDWWWYANDYIWANFPPLYWGYADLLNYAQIKYIPQYY